MMNVVELRDFIRTNFTATAYRWERLPIYEVDSDGSDYGRYLAGEAEPTVARKQPWLDRLASERARGLYRHRVRLLHEPIHDYERYECEWAYVLNGRAGEDVRILRQGEHQLPSILVDHDYWLIDDTHPVRMHYAETGEFLGATLEPSMLDMYRSSRDAAWAMAEPFTDWWGRHPELARSRYGKVS
ncbi:DUF6879 family protein [Pseudonocardia spinosispora]|uniref:DUF6879 family protein n=1 Tax=Pseudonocardia spinosispora TaxID=103441 RepID=UPI000407CAB7|nr:DUF6879 family protein [Pseudonocardia spinosispora]